MFSVQLWILLPLLLGCVCGGGIRKALVPEDPSIDLVLELLLQDELEFEAESESIEGKALRLVGDEWQCGECEDLSRLLYSETSDIQLDTASPAEFQVGVVLDERISCVRVSGAATLAVSVLDGGCAHAVVTLALRTRLADASGAHTVNFSVYG